MISTAELQILEAARAELSGATWAAYRRDLNVFSEWCNRQGFSVVRAEGDDVQRWVEESEESGHTMRRRLAAVRKFYRMALTEGLIHRDPTEGVRPPPAVTRRKPPRLRVEVARALLRAARVAGTQQEALVRLLLIHGIGATEAAALSVGHVGLGLGAGTIQVPGRRARTSLLTAGTLQVLRRHLELRADVVATTQARELTGDDALFVTSTGRRMARGDVWRTVKALGRAAGVEVPSLTLAADVRPLERYLA